MTDTLVQEIHNTPTRAVVIVTGGGSEIFPTLLGQGGGSNTLISGLIPYGVEETVELLGGTPDKLCSEETTRALAMVAFQRAVRLRPVPEGADDPCPVIGVATSSVLQKTGGEREGRVHYIYAALQTVFKTVSVTLVITPEHPIRFGGTGLANELMIRSIEETANTTILLNLIAEGCGVTHRVPLSYGLFVDRHESTISGVMLAGLVEGTVPVMAFDCYYEGTVVANLDASLDRVMNPSPKTIFPGSFNPLHDGHLEMCGVAADELNSNVEFEISIQNVDKPNLDLISLETRLKQFCFDAPGAPARVWVTNTPRFIDKAKAFPGSTFIIGFDTASRIFDMKYTGSIPDVLKAFEDNDARFLVFGREVNGAYQDDFSSFPEAFRERAIMVEEPLQYRSVSSSGIRNAGK